MQINRLVKNLRTVDYAWQRCWKNGREISESKASSNANEYGFVQGAHVLNESELEALWVDLGGEG